jgi:hypothetical protein
VDPSKHTMFQFHTPHGTQFVVWPQHVELRFQKCNGPAVLQWWKDRLVDLEARLPFLTQDIKFEKCETCDGKGTTATGICPDCAGSGRKNFIVPGKTPVSTQPTSTPPTAQQALAECDWESSTTASSTEQSFNHLAHE